MSRSSTAVPAVETAEQPRSTAVPAVDSRLGPPRYVLFDIDGTLIDSQGAGGAAVAGVGRRIRHSQSAIGPAAWSNRFGVFSRLLSLNGLDDTAENFERLSNAYFARLPQELRRAAVESFREFKASWRSCGKLRGVMWAY
ncbi:MAG: hypothetical protein R3C56_12080 [Pirellulaceae bacterium]